MAVAAPWWLPSGVGWVIPIGLLILVGLAVEWFVIDPLIERRRKRRESR